MNVEGLLEWVRRLAGEGSRIEAKFVDFNRLSTWRESMDGKRVVVTNGCFDLIHVGHVICLERARGMGDVLIAGINTDEAIRLLKGNDRPINTAMDRATVLAAMEAVNYVCVFPGIRATDFLFKTRPTTWVKGGDYVMESLDEEERAMALALGATIQFVPPVPGHATSKLVERLKKDLL